MNRLFVVLAAALICFIVDCTSLTLPLEGALQMATSRGRWAVLTGLWLDATICKTTVTVACCGLRTAIACGVLAWVMGAPRTIPLAVVGGFTLNLARVVIVELLVRVDIGLGMMVHDLALFLVIAPLGLLAFFAWQRADRPIRATLATALILSLGVYL